MANNNPPTVGAIVLTSEFVAMLMPRMAPVSLEVTALVSEDVTTTFITAIANTKKGSRKRIWEIFRMYNRVHLYFSSYSKTILVNAEPETVGNDNAPDKTPTCRTTRGNKE